MKDETKGVSGAEGKGFDSLTEAIEWCDEAILEGHEARIQDAQALVSLLVWELNRAKERQRDRELGV